MKRDIGPREEEIAKMREQIANMNSEIIHFQGTNDNMNLIVKDLVSKRNGMETEIVELNKDETNNLNYIKSFEYDISDMYQSVLNVTYYLFRTIKALSRRLYKFIASTFKRTTKSKWKELTSKRSSSKKEPTCNQPSRGLRKNSRRVLSCMITIIRELWVKTNNSLLRLTI